MATQTLSLKKRMAVLAIAGSLALSSGCSNNKDLGTMLMAAMGAGLGALVAMNFAKDNQMAQFLGPAAGALVGVGVAQMMK